MEHHRAVLSDGKQHARIFTLSHGLANDVDGLGLERLQVRRRGGPLQGGLGEMENGGVGAHGDGHARRGREGAQGRDERALGNEQQRLSHVLGQDAEGIEEPGGCHPCQILRVG